MDATKEQIKRLLKETSDTIGCLYATILEDFDEPVIKRLLRYYIDFRDDIITEGRDLYELKKEFDQEMQK